MKKAKEVIKLWAHRISDFANESMNWHVSAFAGQSTFMLFLSFFPILSILLALTPYLPFSEEEIADYLLQVIPKDLAVYVKGLIDDIYSNGAPSLTIVSAVVALWAASKGTLAIRSGLNEIYHARDNRNFIVSRIISAVQTLIAMLILLTVAMINLFGQQIYDDLVNRYEGLHHVGDLFNALRGVGSVLIIFILIWSMYSLMPNRKVLFRYQIWGAVFVAAGWRLVSWGYTFYIEFSLSRSTMYGSLTAIVATLVWLYIIVYLMFLGGMINEFLYLYVYKERYDQVFARKMARAVARAKRKGKLPPAWVRHRLAEIKKMESEGCLDTSAQAALEAIKKAIAETGDQAVNEEPAENTADRTEKEAETKATDMPADEGPEEIEDSEDRPEDEEIEMTKGQRGLTGG